MPTDSADKATFTARIEESVDEVLKEFQDLELEQMRKGEIKARAKLADAKQVIDVKRDRMRQSLKRAHKASGAAWDDAKAGVEAAWSELSEAVANAREDFRSEGRSQDEA